MFETEAQQAEYSRYGGRRWRRRRRRYMPPEEDDQETGLYGTEAEYGEAEYGETEYGYPGGEMEGGYGYGYGEAEGGYGYGEAEGGYGYGAGESEDEYGYGGGGEMEGYGAGESEDEYAYGGGEAEGDFEGEGEEQFLPLIPIAGKVLGGLLGGLLKETGSMYEGEYGEAEAGEAEAGEAEEQFLHKILTKVLGKEAEYGGGAMPPAQEAELAAEMLEVSDEREMDELLGRIVNTIGRAVQGISGAASSPQGRALIQAVKPLATAALSAAGPVPPAAAAVLEMETYEMNEEEQQFEAARRIVRLTSAAAQDAATAPPGAPAQMVGELSLIRAASRVARPLFRNAIRAVSPVARRFFGGGPRPFRVGPGSVRRPGGWYGRPRPGGWYGRSRPWWGGPRVPLPAYRYRRPAYGYGYGPPISVGPPPPEEPGGPMEPGPPPPARPGFRWILAPIDAPPPVVAPPAPAPSPEPPPEGPPPGGAAPPAQSEFGRYGYDRMTGGPSGRWVRRAGKIILLDV